MKRRIGVALSLLAVLTIAGFVNGRAVGANSTQIQPISYVAKEDSNAELGTKENPFTVLEIVPSQQMATMNYLIPGCEQVNPEAMSASQRNAYLSVFAQGDSGLVSATGGLGYSFDADYPMNADVEKADARLLYNAAGVGQRFGQYGYFEHATKEQGKYKYDATKGIFVPIVIGDVLREDTATYTWVPLYNYSDAASVDGTEPYYLKGDTFTEKELAEGQTHFYFEFGADDSLNPTDPFYATACKANSENELPEANQQLVMSKEDIGGADDVEGMRYYQTRFEQAYYEFAKNSIEHKDDLIQKLFPDKSSETGFVSKVVTVTPEQLRGTNLTEEKNVLEEADFIVIHDSEVALPVNQTLANRLELDFSAGSYKKTFAQNDISEEAFTALVHRQASGHPAMMLLDESITSPRMDKLLAVFNKYGAKYFYNVYMDSQETDKNGKPLWNREQIPDANVFQYTKGTGIHTGANDYILNWDGTESFLKQVIYDEAAVRLLKNMPSATKPEKSSLSILELQPIAKFIYGEQGWRSYYLSMFPWFVGTSVNIDDDLHVTTMATYEFNGKHTYDMPGQEGTITDDLNSAYDAILIGANQDETNGLNGYNDEKLGHLAYTTVGDLVSTDSGDVFFFNNANKWFSGNIFDYFNLPTDGIYENRGNFLLSENGTDISQAGIRYNATDVTKKKYNELVDFSQKNVLVLDDDTFYKNGEIDDDKIDKSSLIYSIASNSDKSESQMIRKKSTLQKHPEAGLKNYTCKIEFLEDGKPVEYEAKETNKGTLDVSAIRSNQQKDEDGKNILQYTFRLLGEESSLFSAQLYIDGDGNGDFKDDELSTNLTVEEVTESENRVLGASEKLTGGKTYRVTRHIPESQAGILPWKLVITNANESENASIRDTAMGYTRIELSGEKKTIRVLHMNLTPDMQSTPSEINLDSDKKNKSEIEKKFETYLKSASELDYKVDIDFLSNESFMKKYGNDKKVQEWKEFLLAGDENHPPYDMLILGFRDSASFTNDQTFIAGYKAFAEAGKSIILSHDMVQDRSFAYPFADGLATDIDAKMQKDENRWKVNAKDSAYLRGQSGQVDVHYSVDIKEADKTKQVVGATDFAFSQGEKINLMPKDNLKIYFLPNRGLFDHYSIRRENVMTYQDYVYNVPGYKTPVTNLMDNSVQVLAFLNSLAGSHVDRAGIDVAGLWWNDNAKTNTVKLENQGQITNYPYNIPDEIKVGRTHAQNYKLNLDEDLSTGSGVGSLFNIEGHYDDWDGIPIQGTGYTEQNKGNEGSLVYLEGSNSAYGHIKVSKEQQHNPENMLNFKLSLTRGNDAAYDLYYNMKSENAKDATTVFQLDKNNNVVCKLFQSSDFVENQQNVFYFGDLSAKSTTLSQIENSTDAIVGKIIVTPRAEYIELEYEIYLDKLVEWNNSIFWREKIQQDFKLVDVWHYGVGGIDFSSSHTKDYVEKLLQNQGQSSAIVWFNLSNNTKYDNAVKDNNDVAPIYSAREGDSANNYYIYTKGNITYTGMGHGLTYSDGDVKLTDDEIKLFVNTMIASYRATASPAYLTCENKEAVRNGKLYTIYADERSTGDGSAAYVESITVRLKPHNDSLVKDENVTYHVTVQDENNNVILDTTSLDANGEYTFNVDSNALIDSDAQANRHKKVYTATLVTNDKTEQATRIKIQVLPKQYFALH